METVAERVAVDDSQSAYEQEISRITEKLFLQHLFHLAKAEGMQQVNAVALQTIKESGAKWEKASSNDDNQQAHYTYLLNKIAQFNRNPEEFELPDPPDLPDGSPIGCGE